MTIDEIMALKPCDGYPRARVAELWAGRESLSPAEILDLSIPAADRVWVMCQPGVLPDRILELAARKIVTRAVRTHALPYPASAEWAKRWLDGNRSCGAAEVSAAEVRAAAELALAVAAAAAAEEKERMLQVEDFRAAMEESIDNKRNG